MSDQHQPRVQWSFGACAEHPGAEPYCASAASAGREFGGRFRIEGILGKGAMGVVLRAHDQQVDRPVAIKLQLDPLNEKARARFAREGELAARLNHPGIVRIHGGGLTEDGCPFWVLELVEGARSLEEVLAEDRARGLLLLLEVAQAVACAHEHGVVHRDLKPENVLVDASGRARVGDFGLSWHTEADRLTQTGQMLGTPLFMAPECFESTARAEPRPAVDVWSLGVILYHHLTGAFPFDGAGLHELAARIATAAPRPIRDLAPETSRELEAVCSRALAKAPEDRFPDAAAFADALDLALCAPSRRGSRIVGLLAAVAAVAAVVVALALAFASLSEVEPSRDGGREPHARPPQTETETAVVAAPTPREPASAARALQALLPLAHESTGLREEVLSGFDRVRALCKGDAAQIRRVDLERLRYLYRRGRWAQVVAAIAPLEEDPEVGAEAVLLHAISGWELRQSDPGAREAGKECCRRYWSDASRRAPGAVHATIGAWLAYLEEDYTLAVARSKEAQLLDPNRVEALLIEGMADAMQLEIALALPIFERAQTLAPDNPSACYAVVRALVYLDREPEAIEQSERMLVLLGPRPPRIVFTDHWALLNNAARHAEARRSIEGALARDPGDADLRVRLGVSLLVEDRRPLWAEHVLRETYREAPEVAEEFLTSFPPALGERYRRLMNTPAPAVAPAEWSYALGEEAIAAGEDEEGVRLLREAADGGLAVAMFALGSLHDQGRGVVRNQAEALRWLLEAAKAGSAAAMHNLGVRYAGGEGVPQDFAEAARWYRKAAEAPPQPKQGHAMRELGHCYARGQGVPRDPAEALRWFRRAFAVGDAEVRAGVTHAMEAIYREHPALRDEPSPPE